VKCLACKTIMTELMDDVDYTSVAVLRGTTVTLLDVTIHHCQFCGPSVDYIELPRMGALHRDLAAAKVLHAKHLWFRFVDNEWALIIRTKEPKRPARLRATKKGAP
jgi:hypothetical protein